MRKIVFIVAGFFVLTGCGTGIIKVKPTAVDDIPAVVASSPLEFHSSNRGENLGTGQVEVVEEVAQDDIQGDVVMEDTEAVDEVDQTQGKVENDGSSSLNDSVEVKDNNYLTDAQVKDIGKSVSKSHKKSVEIKAEVSQLVPEVKKEPARINKKHIIIALIILAIFAIATKKFLL